MKIFSTLLLLPIIILCSCSVPDEPTPDGEFEFYITGYKDELTVDFHSGSRTTSTAPEDVHQLHVQILNESFDLVYEQYYYDYDDYYTDSLEANERMDSYYHASEIPDSVFIPKLPSGSYHILAATTFIGNHYYTTAEDAITSPTDYTDPRIVTYTVNDGPIYVGHELITLTEDEQEVLLNMNNISAKITLAPAVTATNFEGWIEMVFQTGNNSFYSFVEDKFLPIEYDYDPAIHTYLDHEYERSFYILPKTLFSVDLNFYDYRTGAYISQHIPLDPSLNLEIGDAVTFTINVTDLLEGAGSGAFDWEDIDWNDLGNISIP